jgi:hypothetical protein
VALEGIAAVMRNETLHVTSPMKRLVVNVMRHLSPTRARELMRRSAKHYRDVPASLDPV